MSSSPDKRDEGVAALNALAEIADAMDLPLAESVSVERLKGHILKAVTIPSHERRIDRCGWCDQSFACYSDPNAECSRLPSAPSTTPRSGERITPAELEHLIEWHDACAKFSVQSDNFVGETAHTARATALRKVDELLCDVGARSAPSATPLFTFEEIALAKATVNNTITLTATDHKLVKLARTILRAADGGKATNG